MRMLFKSKANEIRAILLYLECTPKKESGAAARPVLQLVDADFAAERVAVDAEHARSARLIAVRAVEHALDELLLKLVDRLIEEDPAFHHLSNKGFELISHGRTLLRNAPASLAVFPQASSWPVNRR